VERKKMVKFDAMQENFEEITVLGRPALFTDLRIERDTVPEGLYLYEVRGDDDGGSDPVQIAKRILVNHFGSIIVREPIDLPPDGHIDIDSEKDWSFAGGDCRTVKEFREKMQH
jgi:hypothetical protein